MWISGIRLVAKSMSNVELPTLPLLALLWDHSVGVFSVRCDLDLMQYGLIIP